MEEIQKPERFNLSFDNSIVSKYVSITEPLILFVGQ